MVRGRCVWAYVLVAVRALEPCASRAEHSGVRGGTVHSAPPLATPPLAAQNRAVLPSALWLLPSPAQACWYFGIAEGLIRPNFSDPAFVAAVGSFERRAAPGTYWHSPEFDRVDALTGGALSAKAPAGSDVPHETLGITLGIDFGQTYQFAERSTGIVVAKCVAPCSGGRARQEAAVHARVGAASSAACDGRLLACWQLHSCDLLAARGEGWGGWGGMCVCWGRGCKQLLMVPRCTRPRAGSWTSGPWTAPRPSGTVS